MFGSSSPPVVCRSANVLLVLFALLRIVYETWRMSYEKQSRHVTHIVKTFLCGNGNGHHNTELACVCGFFYFLFWGWGGGVLCVHYCTVSGMSILRISLPFIHHCYPLSNVQLIVSNQSTIDITTRN
jgi:hypothetical protein